jgi:predicted  nucleic acid-binding Zn-ribbon protein
MSSFNLEEDNSDIINISISEQTLEIDLQDNYTNWATIYGEPSTSGTLVNYVTTTVQSYTDSQIAIINTRIDNEVSTINTDLSKKLEISNIQQGDNIRLVFNGNNVQINSAPSENQLNYLFLNNKPQINGVELLDDNTGENYKLEDLANKVTSIDDTSTDVQYPTAKLLYDELETKQNTLTFDVTPTLDSTNPVTSGGVKSYVDTADNTLQTNINNLQSNVNNLKSYVDTADNTLQTNINNLQSNVNTADNTLQTNIDNLQSNVNTADTTLQTNINNLKSYTDIQLATKQNTLTFDVTPTLDSTNPVTSGGVKSYVDTADTTLQTNINNLKSYTDTQLATKQNTLTFDTTPTLDSINPVTSGGVKSYVDTADNTLQTNINNLQTNINNLQTNINNLQSNVNTADNTLQTNINNLKSYTDTQLATKQNTLGYTAENQANKSSSYTESSTTTYTNTKALVDGLATKQNTLTFDVTPTLDSTNPVTSGGVKSYVDTADNTLQTNINDLKSYTDIQLATKQNTLTFDIAPTLNSTNPVTSGGVYNGLNSKIDKSVIGQPLGVASLDNNAKLLITEFPDVIVGALNYSGTLDASTGVCSLVNGSIEGNDGTIYTSLTITSSNASNFRGHFFIVSVEGTIENISNFNIGDWCLSNGTSGWAKIDNTDSVTGVKGNAESEYRIGNINLTPQNIGSVPANALITGDTKTKITYDSNGLILSGSNLTESDIPNLSITKITDITASASEINKLQGVTVSTQQINYLGNVTSDVQSQINAKQNTLTAGTGISIDTATNTISSTVNSATWGNITGTLSNQTDLQTALNAKQNTLTFDTAPTLNSTNPVTSGGIYTALETKQNTLGYTAENQANKSSSYTESSTTTYTNTKALVDGLATKQNTLTFDVTPTLDSTNPVTSGGVYTALSLKQNTLVAGTGISIDTATNTISSTVNSATWGNITGTLSNQTDLQSVLDSKHNNYAPQIVSGKGNTNEVSLLSYSGNVITADCTSTSLNILYYDLTKSTLSTNLSLDMTGKEDGNYTLVVTDEGSILTVSPTPSMATVTLTADGYTQSGNSIYASSGTIISYSVSLPGYDTLTGTYTMGRNDYTLNVSLSESSTLPTGYTSLSAIKSDGSNLRSLDYIITSQTYTKEFEGYAATSSLTRCMTGGSGDGGGTWTASIYYYNNSKYLICGSVTHLIGSVSSLDTTNAVTKLEVLKSSNILNYYRDNSLISNYNWSGKSINGYSENIGGSKETGYAPYSIAYYYYYYKIRENGILKVSLLPCTRTSDSAIGFYDLARETFIAVPSTWTSVA